MVFKLLLIEYDYEIVRFYQRSDTSKLDFISHCSEFKRMGINELLNDKVYITSVDLMKRISHNLYKNKYLKYKETDDKTILGMKSDYTIVWDEFLPTIDYNKYADYTLDILDEDTIKTVQKHNIELSNTLFPLIMN